MEFKKIWQMIFPENVHEHDWIVLIEEIREFGGTSRLTTHVRVCSDIDCYAKEYSNDNCTTWRNCL